jgi:type I restriction enzyme S subunit
MAAVSEQTGSIESSEVRTFGEVSKGFPIFSENDVLFAKITPCMENGKAAIARNLANGTGAGSTEFFVLRPTSKILSEYVFHFIRRTSFRVLCKANFTGSAGQQRVPKSFLEKVLIPLPPLDEQRRIVGVLNRTAEIKRRADAVRAKARAIIPALFLDTFGDPSTNPKGWPYAELSNVAEIGSGLTKGRKLNGQQTVPTPYLRVANVQDGYLQLSEIKSIEATAADLERCALRDGDLLMTEGGDADKLGRCAIWHEEIENCLHQNHIFRVRVGHKLLPDYTAAFIQSDAGKAYFLRVAKRTTGIASVNKTQLGALPVMMPPPALQTVFAEQAQRLQSLVRHLDAAATKAEAMAAAFAEEVFRSSQLGDHAKSLPASRPIDLPDRKLALISALKVRA